MKLRMTAWKKPRIEMIPLIDVVFLVLVTFIYATLSMAVHRGVSVVLPTSSTARVDKHLVLSVTIKSDGTLFIDKEKISWEDLTTALAQQPAGRKDTGVLLFADRTIPYQKIFNALDLIRMSGIQRISLQAEAEQKP
ncbi:MAG: biopolymer transporter ExbD [Deltaproteobacteria bacterium RBG_13_49_15]|nr:MAG: biopolymer transporter ExbD [Deltaproteobacteria bacterium RBG_13_49_15]